MSADREKVISRIKTICNICKENTWRTEFSSDTIYPLLCAAIALLNEDQHQIWELQELNEYLQDKLKEQETELICNLLGGQPYEVYCRECRTMLCILGKGETMNDVKSIFSYCPHCGRKVKWE